jgi:RHS repeat-associated protein
MSTAGSSVSWSYNNDARITSESLTRATHASTTAFAFDADGLQTCASLSTCDTGRSDAIYVGRDAASGRVKDRRLGAFTDSYAANEYGELSSQTASPLKVDYEDLVSTPKVPRDASGRVKRRIERVGIGSSTTRTFDYTYDDQGRLWKVAGAATSEYRYDKNGNRTYAQNTTGIVDGANANIIYDAQDRLLKYGTTTFDYTTAGNLFHRYGLEGTTTYTYDALGALRSVRIPDGRLIEYVVDGFGRRIGKKIDGTLTKQWVYGQGLSPLAELDGAGTVKLRFIYGTRLNSPDAFRTYPDGKLYIVHADQLGTPRVISDAATTQLLEITEYDEFGIKRSDSNTSFEYPFGFAGGLYDPHTNLTRFGARDYDATVGRWVSKDPSLFAGGINLYAYGYNDPINYIDTDGKHPLAVGALVLIGLAISGDTYVEGSGQPMFLAMGMVCLGAAGLVIGGEAVAAITGAGAAAKSDHIALGFEHIVESQAASVGARHLMNDGNWKSTFMNALASGNTKFTVFLDDMRGTGVYDKVMISVARNASARGGGTDFEISQLYQAGRLGSVTFMLGGVPQPNPF